MTDDNTGFDELLRCIDGLLDRGLTADEIRDTFNRALRMLSGSIIIGDILPALRRKGVKI